MKIEKSNLTVMSTVKKTKGILQPNDRKIYYLASPYTHPKKSVENRRFRQISKVGAKLLSQGYLLFTPISASYSLSKVGNLSGGWHFWQALDEEMIRRSDGLIICTIDGWKESVGVRDELKLAKQLGLTVNYLDPISMRLTKRPARKIKKSFWRWVLGC